MARASKRCFCAFCRSQRTVYTKKHVGLADVLLAGLAAALLSYIVYQDLDPRAVIFFAVGLAIAELFIMLRWRLSAICNKCGFDPFLYKRSPERAAQRVKEYMEERKNDPLSLFSPPPKLPVLRKKKSPVLTKKSASTAEASR